MDEPNHFRHRSSNVRAKARAQLAEIRRSRLARRADAASTGAAGEAAAASAPRSDPLPGLPPNGTGAPEARDTPPGAGEAPLPAAPEDRHDPVASSPKSAATSTPSALKAACTAGTGPAAADSDLFALPGAGVGLVWMLNTAGVRTLRDLADADGPQLTRDLGLIGQIMDVGDWIAFARRACGQPTRQPDVIP